MLMSARRLVASALIIVAAGAAAPMDCQGVPLCGVLSLDSGFGPGKRGKRRSKYGHPVPGVHGLWPETGSYGTSGCVAPANASAPTVIYDCYADDESHDDIISFEQHEWAKHGVCAGARDADDYFATICALAQKPLETMAKVRNTGGTLEDMRAALAAAGYEVFDESTYDSELHLSACAAQDGPWTLSPVANFTQACAKKLS